MTDETPGPDMNKPYYRVYPYPPADPRVRSCRVSGVSKDGARVRIHWDDGSDDWCVREALARNLSPTPLAAVEATLPHVRGRVDSLRQELAKWQLYAAWLEAKRAALAAPAGGTTPHGAGDDHGG